MNELKWTTKTPTKPGWYWAIVIGPSGDRQYFDIIRCELTAGDDNRVYREVYEQGIGWDLSYDFSEFTHFMGPIEPPQMPKSVFGDDNEP